MSDKNSLKKRIPISQNRSSGERGAVRELPYAIDPSISSIECRNKDEQWVSVDEHFATSPVNLAPDLMPGYLREAAKQLAGE